MNNKIDSKEISLLKNKDPSTTDKLNVIPERLFDSPTTLDKKNTFKLGIIGGKDVGKSYLFKAMTYRLKNSSKAGALSYFINGLDIKLFRTSDRNKADTQLNFNDYIEQYLNWEQLPPTQKMTQSWYRLSIPYRTGLFRHKTSSFDIEFFDGAGEVFASTDYSESAQKHWLDNYRNAKVMVFCLPLWVVFPKPEFENTVDRRSMLNDFETIIKTYQKMRIIEKITTPLKSILALTMSDETEKTRLGDSLINTWFSPYTKENSDNVFFNKLRKGGSINRYLANARKVSNLLHQEFQNADVLTESIPRNLTFDAGRPWIIPLSALDGKYLDLADKMDQDDPNTNRDFLPLPNPAHVELPLLVALCEHTNALM